MERKYSFFAKQFKRQNVIKLHIVIVVARLPSIGAAETVNIKIESHEKSKNY